MYFDPAEQCIGKMVAFMRQNPTAALPVAGCTTTTAQHAHLGPAISDAARRSPPGDWGLGRLMPRTLDRYLYRERAMDESWACDWLSGCFLLVRRAAFEQVGFFDTRFVKYFEDVDMCLRMARAGWQVMYHGATYCYHAEQRDSKRLFSADGREHLRSYMRWLAKWGLAPSGPSRRRPSPVAPRRCCAEDGGATPDSATFRLPSYWFLLRKHL